MQRVKVAPKDRIAGMLIASAIADAMAGPHEGRGTHQSQRFLEEGGWIDEFDTYSEWYQSHWNVYAKNAVPGTYTDDTRLRLLIAETMLENEKENPGTLVTREFLAGQIFSRYQQAYIEFQRKWKSYTTAAGCTGDKRLDQSCKESFLQLWFLWELVKPATSIYLPENPPLFFPEVKRVDHFDAEGKRTSVWHLSECDPIRITGNIKDSFHEYSYQKGEELAFGLIALLPLSIYFPGKPAEAFHYFIEVDFLDIKSANLYTAVAGAILADLLGGETWDRVARKISTAGLEDYVQYNNGKDLKTIREGIILALQISTEFKKLSGYPARDNYIKFIETLHKHFGVGEEMMCTSHEMFLVPVAIVDYAPNDLQQLIEMAVNYGRDNDTVASIAASFGGAIMGIDNLPARWQEIVKNANPEVDIQSISQSLINLC